MAHDAILEQLRRDFSAEEYREVRELWKHHSISEDNRDIAGLMSTLTDDCVYELVQTGHRWEGKPGATRFYMELLGAFPDIVFNLSDIVIGPQGVFEMADVTGTHQGPWLGVEPTNLPVEFKVVIYFPWHPQAKLFKGEKVWFHAGEAAAGSFPAHL
jgi:predicted ester cyclase